MNIAITGCGLIGQKRLRALQNTHKIVSLADTVIERARLLATQCEGAYAHSDWQAAIARPGVDAVIVATPNQWLAPITAYAVQRGKHVLVEKPAAIRSAELLPIIADSEERKVSVQVGFNHRFHPSFQKAREIIDSGVLGDLMFIRGRYGHGGRVGYDKEWRADPAISGGGELLDQGVHLIDLARWFLGDFTTVHGHSTTYFWKMSVDDNAFLNLRTPSGQTAWLHASCTEWKNMFSFEIYGRDGKLQIDGLGGSYGTERIAFYRMLPQMGPPETTIWEYPGEDVSWKLELSSFFESIRTGAPQGPGLRDAYAALHIVEKIYQQSNS
ncbi:MAG TPA: Gfo/Idh/MocA family oxidoreductase [Bryobacteraceae bacterium]|nr:Gfo/Idh/MocA family oxidoreductase [Bryobacteraceae bacterium]